MDREAPAPAGGTAAGPVIGVVGGSGGVGASTFAAVLALSAAASGADGVLVDADVAAGGIDVLLGIEGVAGARWSGLRLDGGYLDPDDLLAGLPRAGGAAVLSSDVPALDGAAVEQVLDAAGAAGPVVVDLPRGRCAERSAGLSRCLLVVLVVRADVAGLVAARAMAASLAPVPVGVVVRRGQVSGPEAAELIGAELLGELPALDAPWPGIDVRRPPRAITWIADGLLAGVGPDRDGGTAPPVDAGLVGAGWARW